MCMCCVITIHARGMKVKVPVQDAWASRVSLLPPPPYSVGGVAGGGGGGWVAGWVLPGDSEQGRGVLWQANTVSCSGAYFWRVNSVG
jgi:hypothetical protein